LANGYRNSRFGTKLAPVLPIGRYVIPWIPFLRGALLQQMRSLPPRHRPDARLLDVGCGNGGFLQLARSAGWVVQGVDFDAVAVSTARSLGLDIRQGGLELLQECEDESFAWISLSHVLEHVHSPMLWLHELHRLLEPGGTLWLQTPNINSLGHARYQEDWRGLEPPRHLALWTLETLCQNLKEVGFRKVRALPTPVLTGMDLCASSEALRAGMDYAAFAESKRAQRRRFRHFLPAVLQFFIVRRGEFLTLIATK
jgi:SAM-dependent methyltransferase